VTSCIPNIGPQERLKRLRIGIGAGLFGVVSAVVLVAGGAGRGWRLLLLLPFLLAAISLFQVRETTCVALAARGLRNMDAGDEPIADPVELQTVKAQARRVNLQAAVVAAGIVGVLMMI
jgi:hypothetical protein